MDEITVLERLIGSYGFPIVVAGWLLWERRTMMTNFTTALNEVKTAVVALTAAVKGGNEK